MAAIQDQELRAQAPMRCSRAAFGRGLRGSATLAFGSAVWGVTFGVVASDAGLNWLTSVLMSLTVFSGAAQVIGVQMMESDAGVAAIGLATGLISLRYVVMGITMHSWFLETPRWIFWPGIHFTSDQSWALMVRELEQHRRDVGYFFGFNAGQAVHWLAGTFVGATIGGWLGPGMYGLHFASTAALVGVLAGMRCRRRDLAPWLAAGGAAIAAQHVMGGYTYILVGVVIGLAAFLLTGGDNDRA